MRKQCTYEDLQKILNSHKDVDKEWFLALLDDEAQNTLETERVEAVMQMMRLVRIRPHKRKIIEAQEKIAQIEKNRNPSAADVVAVRTLSAEIALETEKMEEYRSYFEEPYFARMDLVDDKEGYNSYYIGKKGDSKLEIVDWRAPVAKRYYQKSCASFSFGEYAYRAILRRALRVKNGRFLEYKNEYLSLKDYLTEEEIGGRDEDNVLDPFLREIIRNRKEETAIQDIIRTIQEKQYEIITLPEDTNFILQGCAGSGKTMVMLHRLSYLMYNHDGIRAHDVLIITPSKSFTAFINELATVLELNGIRTLTIQQYFMQVLKNEKIDLSEKIDFSQKEDEGYLSYVYSAQFPKDLKKKMEKVYDGLYGLFTGEECKAFIAQIIFDCKRQISVYDKIKNASLRIRRTVLGEIKEKKEGGLYYTKRYRNLMNAVLDVVDFFDGTLKSEKAKTPEYFYRQLLSFFKSASYLSRRADEITKEALDGLENLAAEIQKEIVDLRRFKQKVGNQETYLYADRIERREALLQETERIKNAVREIEDCTTAFCEFYQYLFGEKSFSALGGGESFVDVVRYFYRQTVKRYKLKYGMNSKNMYASDAYAVCLICHYLGRRLTPAHSYVFVDEGQDISEGEYRLLQSINNSAAFNLFGDVEQNITGYRGIKDWLQAFESYRLFTLNQNYRNTNQIVDFVSSQLSVDMQSIGYDGPPVERIKPRAISAFFKEKKGLKAIICSAEDKEKYLRKAYNDLSTKGTISKTKINVMTVYESKGLEFSSVAVVPTRMTENERYIAYTRALQYLAIIDEG
ncbi:MAG: AAA family ATPase [Clostridia bacterium]|nr:AAA family ATPase [Clostridia bacterium]